MPAAYHTWKAVLIASAFVLTAVGAPLPMTAPKPGTVVDYGRDVFPILKANCIACHNKTTTKADLNMETPELMRKGGESGAGLIAGKAEESLIFEAALHTWDSDMPPKNNKVGAVNLTPEELGVLRLWINSGAKGGTRQAQEVVWQPLPAGLNPIYATAMTADGRWAVCSRANQIYLYDLGTNRLVTPLADPALSGVAHRDMVQTLAFSPDGLRLASGSFQEIKLWKRQATGRAEAAPAAVATTEAVQKLLLEMKLGAAQPAALSSDGKRLAVGDAAGVVRTYDVARMKPLLDLRMDYTARRALEALQWEIARQQLEVNFQQDFIKAEETAAKALEDRQKKARDAIATAKKAIEEKKKALPAAQTEKTTVDKEVAEVQALIAKAPDGKPDAALEKKLKEAQDKQTKAVKAESDAVAAVKTAEGQASDAEAEVKIIEDAKGKAAQTIAAAKKALETANQLLVKHKVEVAKPVLPDPERDGIQSVGFSADGLRLVAVTLAGVTKEWAADTGVALVVEKDAHAWVLERTLTSPFLIDRVNVVRFSPDGKTLAAGSGEPSRSGDVTLWEAATGKLLQTWQEKHSDAVLSLDFSPDGKRLATGGADKAVRISELPGGKLVRNLEGHTHHILGLAFRADGRILASAGADNAVKIWDMLTGDRKKNIDGWDKEVTSIQFLGATDQIVTSAGDNRLRVVKDAGGEVRSLSGLPDFMFSAATSRLGDRFIGGGQDSVLRVWEAEKGTEVAQFKAE